MAKLMLVLVLTVMSISAITEAQFGSCPPNCSVRGCTTGYCFYYNTSNRGTCVRNCPAGMYCDHGAISVCRRNRG